jgi:hypothetical protein
VNLTGGGPYSTPTTSSFQNIKWLFPMGIEGAGVILLIVGLGFGELDKAQNTFC